MLNKELLHSLAKEFTRNDFVKACKFRCKDLGISFDSHMYYEWYTSHGY